VAIILRAHACWARPTIVRRGHPCAWGARRAPHGRPHGPRARAPRSAPRPLLVQRRASAPRPPAPRLRRMRVLLPRPLSHGWWGCQGTRPPPRPPGAPPTPRVLVHIGGAATRTGPWGGAPPGRARRGGPAAAPGPLTIVGRAHACWGALSIVRVSATGLRLKSHGKPRRLKPHGDAARRDTSVSVVCHATLVAGRVSQSEGTPMRPSAVLKRLLCSGVPPGTAGAGERFAADERR